jgi:hypothetical protein
MMFGWILCCLAKCCRVRSPRSAASATSALNDARYLAAAGERTDVPGRSPPRDPPYWKSQVLRRQAPGDQGEGGDNRTDHEAA